jgi:DegV family protein with EDD domain
MAIKIVTDSVSDLPPSVVQANDITVVPLYVAIGSETYKDGVDMDADRFYSLLQELPQLPTTSQPSAADFEEVYRPLVDEGHQVVSVHISSKLSGTVNSALQAKESMGEEAQIEIVDSELAGGALGLLALNAARWAKEMSDYGELAQRVRQSIPKNLAFVVIDTLKYLEKGGRIGKAQAFLGGVLQFKPILSVRDGEVHPVERPRTRRRALARIVELVRGMAPISQMHISHSTGPDDAHAIREQLADLVEPEHIIESRFGPVLGTHLGPNTIGVGLTRGDAEDK